MAIADVKEDSKMRMKTGLMLLVGACVISAGCRKTFEYSYWLPEFSSTQSSGVGGTSLDLKNQLGVVTDEQVVVYDLIGDAGRNRFRLDSWMIHGEGITDAHTGFEFDLLTFLPLVNVETIVDLESHGFLWEPAIIKTDSFRLRIALGFDLVKFKVSVVDILVPSNEGTIELPGPDGLLGEIGYMPVPKVGVSFEKDLKPWMRLHARAQMFDASYLELDANFSGTFTNAVGGLVFGKHRGVRIFVGYRYFNAAVQYKNDIGDTTLQGLLGSVSLRF
jgi:hypothetical protein